VRARAGEWRARRRRPLRRGLRDADGWRQFREEGRPGVLGGVAGTQCSVKPKTASTATEDACLGCLFYLLVMEEEYPAYESTGRILELLR